MIWRVQWRDWAWPCALAFSLFITIYFSIGYSYTVDDLHYLQAAEGWVTSPPFVGTTHWGLRHTLNLPLAFIFKIVGIKEAAYYILPALYLVGFFSVSFLYLKRCVGQGVAGTTCLLFLSVPIVRDMGGRNYPDFIELTWVLAALALIFEAYKAPRGRARYILLVLSGLSASLALLTRETSAWVILVYAFLFLRGKPFTRTEMLYVLAGALPLLLADTLYLHVMTGDWLYRLHVSSAHTTILSSHMRGGTFNGPVLFNAELAKRWTVDGPFYVHWAVNPLIYFFFDPRYGLLWWIALIAGMMSRWGRNLAPVRQHLLLYLLGISALAYAFPTYVLMVSQRPRYYLISIFCMALIVAILMESQWKERLFRKVMIVLVCAQVLCWLVSVELVSPRMLAMRRASVIIESQPTVTYANFELAHMVRFNMELKAYQSHVRIGLPPIGQHMVVVTRNGVPLVSDVGASRIASYICWQKVYVEKIPKTGVMGLINILGVKAHVLPPKKLWSRTHVELLRRMPDAPCQPNSFAFPSKN